MTLKAQIESDVEEVFFNADEFAETVTYTQGTLDPISILAIPEIIEFESLGEAGLMSRVEQAVWQIPASQLGSVHPRTGDRIARPVGNDTWVYEVMPPESGELDVNRDVTTHIFKVWSKRVG